MKRAWGRIGMAVILRQAEEMASEQVVEGNDGQNYKFIWRKNILSGGNSMAMRQGKKLELFKDQSTAERVGKWMVRNKEVARRQISQGLGGQHMYLRFYSECDGELCEAFEQ